MTSSTILLAGVDRHRDRYRVRKAFPQPYGRVIEIYDTPARANAAALELDERRAHGLPPREGAGDTTLGEAAAALLKHKRAHGGKRGRKLTKAGLAFWTRSLKPWAEGEHAATPLPLLSRKRLAATLLDRALEAPTSARNERAALMAALELAAGEGATFDLAILRIPLVAVQARERRALSALELEYLGSTTTRPASGSKLSTMRMRSL